MNTKEMIDVMEAFENKKNIQKRPVESTNKDDWEVEMSPSWDWDKYEYRVLIKLIDAFYYEFYKDNVWTVSARRFTEEEVVDEVARNQYDEFAPIKEMGKKQVEDNSHLIE